MCWHKWSKWTEFKVIVRKIGFKDKKGNFIEGEETRQKCYCLKCGYSRYERVLVTED